MQKALGEARGQNIDSCSALAVHHMPELGRKPAVLVHPLHQTPSSLPERSSPLNLAEVCIISLFAANRLLFHFYYGRLFISPRQSHPAVRWYKNVTNAKGIDPTPLVFQGLSFGASSVSCICRPLICEMCRGDRGDFGIISKHHAGTRKLPQWFYLLLIGGAWNKKIQV